MIEFEKDDEAVKKDQQPTGPVSTTENTGNEQQPDTTTLAPVPESTTAPPEETITEPITALPIVEITEQQPETKEVVTKKEKKKPERLVISVAFPADEEGHVQHIIDERVKAGFTRDNAHFIRQCVDFAINYKFVFKQKGFSIPDDSPQLFLKDAYYNNKK